MTIRRQANTVSSPLGFHSRMAVVLCAAGAVLHCLCGCEESISTSRQPPPGLTFRRGDTREAILAKARTVYPAAGFVDAADHHSLTYEALVDDVKWPVLDRAMAVFGFDDGGRAVDCGVLASVPAMIVDSGRNLHPVATGQPNPQNALAIVRVGETYKGEGRWAMFEGFGNSGFHLRFPGTTLGGGFRGMDVSYAGPKGPFLYKIRKVPVGRRVLVYQIIYLQCGAATLEVRDGTARLVESVPDGWYEWRAPKSLIQGL